MIPYTKKGDQEDRTGSESVLIGKAFCSAKRAEETFMSVDERAANGHPTYPRSKELEENRLSLGQRIIVLGSKTGHIKGTGGRNKESKK
jgi:hypothetical protein